MNNIAFNIHLQSALKVKYQIYLALLPCSFIFGSLWLILQNVEVLFDLNSSAWVEYPFVAVPIFALSLVVVAFIASLFGWLLNALISSTCFNWNQTQLKEVYLHSRVPSHWRKDASSTDQPISPKNKMEQWRQQRQKSMLKHVLKVGILKYSSIIFLCSFITPRLVAAKPIESSQILFYMSISVVIGTLFGCFDWYFSERKYRKYKMEK